MKNIVISLSGGMDSSTLLLRSIAEVGAENVTAISFNYGQKHVCELERAQQLVDYLAEAGHKVNYQPIVIDGITALLNSSLVTGGSEVPEGHYAEENMRATVVPNRNKIFASLIQSVALSIATEKRQDTAIAMGIHAGDHAVYPDCRQEFRDADDSAFRLGNWEAEFVSYFTPYLLGDKFDILKDGVTLCEQLNIDFDEVYKRTNTSYKPINIDGQWYSDYKSASSVERVEAFMKLGRPDPVAYADETGPVHYNHVMSSVQRVLEEHAA